MAFAEGQRLKGYRVDDHHLPSPETFRQYFAREKRRGEVYVTFPMESALFSTYEQHAAQMQVSPAQLFGQAIQGFASQWKER